MLNISCYYALLCPAMLQYMWAYYAYAQLCPVLCNSMDSNPPGSFLCLWNSPSKNTGVGCHALLQGITPTQGWSPGFLHCRRVLNHAKLLQLFPTLCDPIDGSPPGSPIPGILQARTLEWVVISFSNAWKWKVKVKSLSHVRLLATPWAAAYQAPLSMWFSRQEYWSGVPLPSPPVVVRKMQINATMIYHSGLFVMSIIKQSWWITNNNNYLRECLEQWE